MDSYSLTTLRMRGGFGANGTCPGGCTLIPGDRPKAAGSKLASIRHFLDLVRDFLHQVPTRIPRVRDHRRFDEVSSPLTRSDGFGHGAIEDATDGRSSGGHKRVRSFSVEPSSY